MALHPRDHYVDIVDITGWSALSVGFGAGAWLAIDAGGWNLLAMLFLGLLGMIFVGFPLGLVLVGIYRCFEGIGELRDRLRYGRFLGR